MLPDKKRRMDQDERPDRRRRRIRDIEEDEWREDMRDLDGVLDDEILDSDLSEEDQEV